MVVLELHRRVAGVLNESFFLSFTELFVQLRREITI